MLLKVVHRGDKTKSCLISLCRWRWIESGDTTKKQLLLSALIKNGYLHRSFTMNDLKLEPRKSPNGVYYWTMNKLSRARDRWVLFVKIEILSKHRH